MPNLDWLRERAVSHSLFRPTTLKAAIARLGFVQADPIRSPARAQDLILRHRVEGYREGDLDRSYASLEIEEDRFYTYGFLPREIAALLYPRKAKRLAKLEHRVLEVVRECGPTHPSALEAVFGGARVINAWGGYSKATKRALERLHHHGLLRIARREKGIRVYEVAPTPVDPLPHGARFEKLVLVAANVLAPVVETTLYAIASHLRRFAPGVTNHRPILRALLRTGQLESAAVDGVRYLWPAFAHVPEPPPQGVRCLAPFDPVVWDRRRFQHLWQWPYRFEAYTPQAKRLRGYYAMPLLWRDQVIGWANATVVAKKLSVEFGFVERRPRDRQFRREADAEIARLEAFLDDKRASQN